MKKKAIKVLAVILTICVMIGATSLCASAYSSDITGTVEFNGESRLNNYGFVWQNQSRIVNNREDATVHNNQPQAEITYNYGTVGSSTTSSRLYGSAGNEGTIDYNYGVLVSNLEGGSLYRNYGRITGYNFGTITDNQEGAYLFCNAGIMNENYGTVEYNTRGGMLYSNVGLITEANTGTVGVNRGTIQRSGATSAYAFDTGKVEENYGTIVSNAYRSTVEKNAGTITDNTGCVRNYTGGSVGNNARDGVVYNYGGTVQRNEGKHYLRADLKTAHATVAYGEGFSSDNGVDCWLLEGASGTAVITPDEDYEITSIPADSRITSAVKNNDGSWSVTVGGLSANVSADDLGITAAPMPDNYTVSIITGDHGEDLSVEAARGARFFDALDNAGVFETLDAMETEDHIFRDLATKPLSEFADQEAFSDDAYSLLNTTVTSDMTVYACFYTKIKQVTLTVERPVVGTTVTITNDIQTPSPVLTAEEGAHYSFYTDADYQYSQWYTKDNDEYRPFEGAFEEGGTYYVDCLLAPDFGYWMDDDTVVTANGATVEEATGRMSLSVTLSAKAVFPAILGDADGDGNVTVIDATWIQRYLADMKVPNAFNEAAADADSDGDVSIIDATWIQRWLAEMTIPYPIGKTI